MKAEDHIVSYPKFIRRALVHATDGSWLFYCWMVFEIIYHSAKLAWRMLKLTGEFRSNKQGITHLLVADTSNRWRTLYLY